MGDAAAAGAALAVGAAGLGEQAGEGDGARAVDEVPQDHEGVLDVEVGEVVGDVGAQHVGVAGVAQLGEVVDGVVGAPSRAVGVGVGGEVEVDGAGDGVEEGAFDDAIADGRDAEGSYAVTVGLGDVVAEERCRTVGAVAQLLTQLGDDLVRPGGDRLGFLREVAVVGVVGEDALPAPCQVLDRCECGEQTVSG